VLLNKIKGVTSVFMISLLFALVAFNLQNQLQMKASSNELRYILDAGHGIPDGGTSGSDGTTEQELNLSITKKISNFLTEQNVSHLLTRTNENSIYTEGNTIHAKKVSDIRQRIAIADKTPAVPLISIHMNSYPDPSVHGIQVFYSENDPKAKGIAQALQLELNTQLQPQNTKNIKSISKNIYLFSHISNPSVLIECGFLSNSVDLSNLRSEDYQTKLSKIIAEVLAIQE